MSKLIVDPVINSNCLNFLHTNLQQKDVHQIQPDKFTFLKSNLLISNILNRNISKQKKNVSQRPEQTPPDSDAYINCEVQQSKLKEERQVKKLRIQRVRNLARCRSQVTFEQLREEQKHVNEMINNVYMMHKEMTEKAAEIMGKKQNHSYMGRNLFNNNQNFLKQMKQSNPNEKETKIQTTRLFMKERAKRHNQKQYKQLLQQSMMNTSYCSNQSSYSNLNSSLEASLLDISYSKAIQNKARNDDVLRKLIKNKSEQNFMQEQRRKAVWNGFSTHWRKGCEKGDEQVKELKKKATKKNVKPKFQKNQQQILSYNDACSRHIALKDYQNLFASTVASFQIKIK